MSEAQSFRARTDCTYSRSGTQQRQFKDPSVLDFYKPAPNQSHYSDTFGQSYAQKS